jgi:ubiquinone/menaquinone biosynthesis C-methylase UbiE
MPHNDFTLEETDLDQQFKRQMEKAAPTYDSLMKRMTFGRERELRETTVNLAWMKPGDCVLEVGCGTGTLTLAAKRRVGSSGKVFGIDIIPTMIELSERKASLAREEITFQLASIADIPFPENTFNVVMCSFMIFHMSEKVRQKGMTEIFRVLKPQGCLLVLDSATPTRPFIKTFVKLISAGELPPDLHQLRPLMELSGFSQIEIAPVNFQLLGFSPLTFVRGIAQKKKPD